jgi:polyphenol oxidase
VSAAPFDTLNFSFTTGDAPEAVRTNIGRAAEVLGVEPERIYFLTQVHGTACRVIDGAEPSAAIRSERGDVTLSRAPSVACAVRVADCVPVLLADRRSGAVAAVHAGWRGVVRGVVPAAVAALRALGRGPLDLVAAIGPHIASCCFEVGPEVAAELAAASALGESVVVRGRGNPHVELGRIVEAQLRASEPARLAVDHVPGCTVCDRERFHSYRRDGSRGGRMLAAIVPHA